MSNHQWMPPQTLNHEGRERCVGVELEMAGLDPQVMAHSIQSVFGGELTRNSRFEFHVEDTSLGNFGIELDATYLKSIGYRLEKKNQAGEEFSFEHLATDIIALAAEQVVPWEITTPPIPMSRLHELEALVNSLRDVGAQGTRSGLVYAFGVHFNPELPAVDVRTILNYLRAFLCLFEWIADEDDTDLTRRLTSYINHFNKPYILKVLDIEYRPTLRQFMLDYLEANPTRNRTLDLLPLFAWLDKSFLREHIEDPRVKGRPTLHYRLPNCDIDNPQWSLWQPWREWLQVEYLVNQPDKLTAMCAAYREHLDSLLSGLDNTWLKSIGRWLHKDD